MTPNQSHGHVTPNADGSRARCGGPTICKVCMAELAQLQAKSAPAEPSREAVERWAFSVGNLMEQEEDGEYVEFKDHERIVAALTAPPSPDAELVALLDFLRDTLMHHREGDAISRIDAKLASLK